MKVHSILDFKDGWIIGDFEPSVFKTAEFEVGVLVHKKDDSWPKHYHKKSIEYNVLMKGSMVIQDTLLSSGDVFILEKGEIADPEFLTDCYLVTIKVPSVPGDKYIVGD